MVGLSDVRFMLKRCCTNNMAVVVVKEACCLLWLAVGFVLPDLLSNAW